MSDANSVNDPLGGLSPQQQVDIFRSQFELAWQQALEGAPPPHISIYLSFCPDAIRPTLAQELERIDEQYRRTRSLPPTDAADSAYRGTLTWSDRPGAVPGLPDTKHGRQEKTVPPGASASAFDERGTVEAGRDPRPPRPLATVVSSDVHNTSFVLADASAVQGEENDQHVSGYEILEILGRGAMGVVYKARQRGLKRIVALKMVLAGDDATESELARFRTEAETVAELQNPNSVQVYEVGEHQGRPFLSLEYVDGGSLQGRLGGQPQPIEPAAQLIQVLALAMDSAHRRGVVHRDLKPANVLLTRPHEAGTSESTISIAPLVEQVYGTPKIADFGLAKRLQEDGGQTRSGTILGTPSYMAPEQAEGQSKNVGPLADQYALGAMLYETLTGRPPFKGSTVWETLDQVRSKEPVPPSQLQPKVPHDLETICLKALQKEPGKRYDSCAALAEDLRCFLAGLPIRARPVSSWERTWRWCRRNPWVASLLGFIACLILTMLGASIWFNVVLTKKNEETQQARDVAQDQATLALESLLLLVDEVQKELRDRPEMQNLERTLLSKGKEGLERVTANASKDQGIPQRSIAKAHEQLGAIFRKLGQLDVALAEYQKYEPFVMEEARAKPTSPKALGNLAATLRALGLIAQSKGDLDAAQDYYQQALQFQKEAVALVERWPADEPLERNVTRAGMQQNLAYLFEGLGLTARTDAAAALRFHQQAFQIRKALLDAEPTNRELQRDVAGAHLQLARAFLRVGDAKAWGENLRKSLTLQEACFTQDPDNTQLKMAVGFARIGLGEYYVAVEAPAEALKYYDAGRQLFADLHKADKQRYEYLTGLADSQYGLATVAYELGNRALAATHYAGALQARQELADRLKTPAAKKELMLSLASCGRVDEASAIADRIRQIQPFAEQCEYLYSAACCYALCIRSLTPPETSALPPDVKSKIESLTTRAFQALHRAVEVGGEELAWLAVDPELKSLRTLPTFAEILKGAQKKTLLLGGLSS